MKRGGRRESLPSFHSTEKGSGVRLGAAGGEEKEGRAL